MLAALFYLLALIPLALVCGWVALRLSVAKWPNRFTIAFFHPYWCVHGAVAA